MKGWEKMAHAILRDDRYFGNHHHRAVWPLWVGPCLFSQGIWINARKYKINTDRKSVGTNVRKFAITPQTHSDKTASDYNQHLVNATWHASHSCKTIWGNMAKAEFNAVYTQLLNTACRPVANVHDQPYRSNMYMTKISPVEHAIPPAVHLWTMRLPGRYLYTRHIVLLLNFGFHRFASLSAHGKVCQVVWF